MYGYGSDSRKYIRKASLAVKRFSAQIHVDAGGYEWTPYEGFGTRDAGERQRLEPIQLEDFCESWKVLGEAMLRESSYDPFITEPALYRVFAKLEPTPEAILQFANRYGELATVPEIVETGGSSLGVWKDCISEMRNWIEDADKLLSSASSRKSAALGGRKIASFVSRLLEDVPVFIEASEYRGAVTLATRAYHLLDAMKLQLADAVVERKAYRDCELCGKPYEVSPQFNRSDRVYCSDNCRVKAYQRRRKQAIAMRAKCDSLREIAKKLGSDVPTVKKWVGEARKEE